MDTPWTWTLRVIDAGGAPQEYAVKDGLTIGRHPDCDITINDSHVSKWHATVVAHDGGFAVMDLGSNNGTQVGQDRVLKKDETQPLEMGLAIRVGTTQLFAFGSADPQESTIEGRLPQPEAPPKPAVAPAPTPEPPTFPEPAHASDAEFGISTRPADETPKPRPAPTPAQEPSVPAKRPTPDSPPADALNEFATIHTLVGHGGEDLNTAAALKSMGARLIMLNEADLRIIPIEATEVVIGRSSEAAIGLDNRGVSAKHAKLRFNGASHVFSLEDLESANGTFIAGAPLPPGSSRELESDTHLRFGTIDAVFMTEVDADFHSFPASRHEDAARLLRSEGKLTSAVYKQASQEAKELGQSLGESLLLGQHVSPRDWSYAVKDARMAANVAAITGTGGRNWLPLMILIAVAAAAAIFGWWKLRGGDVPAGLILPMTLDPVSLRI